MANYGDVISGKASVKATLRAGISYKSVAVAKGNKVRVWVEEEKTGRRVSNVDTPGVSIQPTEIPVIIYY